jgi:hypothetical protein
MMRMGKTRAWRRRSDAVTMATVRATPAADLIFCLRICLFRCPRIRKWLAQTVGRFEICSLGMSLVFNVFSYPSRTCYLKGMESGACSRNSGNVLINEPCFRSLDGPLCGAFSSCGIYKLYYFRGNVRKWMPKQL